MHVDPPEPAPHQGVSVNEGQHFLLVHDRRLGEIVKEPQDFAPASERAAGEFTHYEGVAEHSFLEQQPGELPIGDAEMVDPDGGIDQNHWEVRPARVRRRGTGRTAFSEPPSAASRRALSRATRASSPALTTAVFSRRPLSCVALPSSASSMFSVVRMCIMMLV